MPSNSRVPLVRNCGWWWPHCRARVCVCPSIKPNDIVYPAPLLVVFCPPLWLLCPTIRPYLLNGMHLYCNCVP